MCGVWVRGEQNVVLNVPYPPISRTVCRAVDAFARQLYLSMLAQALIVKSAVEVQRSMNTWGTVLWQARLVLDRTPVRSCYPVLARPLPCAAQRDLADGRLGVYRVRCRRRSLDGWSGSWRPLEASAGGLQEGPQQWSLLLFQTKWCVARFVIFRSLCSTGLPSIYIATSSLCAVSTDAASSKTMTPSPWLAILQLQRLGASFRS